MGRFFGYMIFRGICATDSWGFVLTVIGLLILAALAIAVVMFIGSFIWVFAIEPIYMKIKAWAESKWGSGDSDEGEGDTLSSKLMRCVILACCLLLLIVCISV